MSTPTFAEAANTLADRIDNMADDMLDDVQPPNIIYAAVPALIASMIIAILMFLVLPITGYSIAKSCKNNVCKDVPYNNRWNLVWIIAVPSVVGLIIYVTIYNIMWAYKNPKQYAHQAALQKTISAAL